MDVVIPYRRSTNDDVELMYALRSIERELPERGNVFIIGQAPSWLTNVIHIPCTELPDEKFKERNIYNKIMMACGDQRVSDSFFCTNDDIFLLPGYQPAYHHKGLLSRTLAGLSVHRSYRFTVSNTMLLLKGGYDFDTHCPIVYNKDVFLRALEPRNWPQWGYCIKSVYCNMAGIPGEYYADLKITKHLRPVDIKQLIAGRQYFSIGEHAVNDHMKSVLSELYPNRSMYEKS